MKQWKALVYLINERLMIRFISTYIKVLVVDFQKKKMKKVFVVRDETSYFSEALGISLLVNPALGIHNKSRQKSLAYFGH